MNRLRLNMVGNIVVVPSDGKLTEADQRRRRQLAKRTTPRSQGTDFLAGSSSLL
jgi:hypothetical protein